MRYPAGMAALALVLAAGAGPSAAQVGGAIAAPGAPSAPAQTTAGDGQAPAPSIITINQQALFMRSHWGRRVQAEADAQSVQIEAENDRLVSQFAAEEQALTALRGSLPPDEFRARADEFDKRVVAVRRERDTMKVALQADAENERAAFFRAALPVLAQVMQERGAVVVLDQSAIFVAAQSIDVTDLLIERLDREIGAGPAQPAPSGTANPAEAPENGSAETAPQIAPRQTDPSQTDPPQAPAPTAP